MIIRSVQGSRRCVRPPGRRRPSIYGHRPGVASRRYWWVLRGAPAARTGSTAWLILRRGFIIPAGGPNITSLNHSARRTGFDLVSHHLLPVHTRVHLDTGALLFGIGLALCVPWPARAGSARDYLSAPIDSWLAFYNAGPIYATSVTPEDGLDVAALVRTNVLSQSVSLTRTMDYFGRTGWLPVHSSHTYMEIEFRWRSNFGRRHFGRGFSLADKPLWRACADPGTVSLSCPSDLCELSPFRRHPAR